MTIYTKVFGNDTIPPSGLGYVALSISANTALVWPFNTTGGDAVTPITELTATLAALELALPDATGASPGQDMLIKNVGAEDVTLTDDGSNAVSTLQAGTATYVYLKDNSTANGSWGTIDFGVGTSSVDAATLVGYGIIASGNTLNVASPVASSATGVTITSTYRGKTFVFTGGSDTLALTAVATLGDNFYCFVKNSGTGTLTVDPDGAETIDGQSSLTMQPGESAMIVCSGTAWYTVGYGRSVLYQFSQLVKDVSAAGTITLTASEAANKLLTFNGNPASDLNVVVPNTVAIYYVQSAISTAKTITVKTAAGTGAAVAQSVRAILICDGTNVTSAQTAIATGGVALDSGSAAAPSLNFSSATNTGLFLKGTNGVGISANGVEAMAVETTGTTLATPLVVASGGSGRATGTTAYALIATGTTATGAQQTLAAGATTEILVGGGAAALPVWTAATGSGAPVRATSPTLVTPLLGTPTSGTLTNCTGLPISSGVAGLGTGVATALAINTGSAGAPVLFDGALGTPSSGDLSNCTNYPVSGTVPTGTVFDYVGSTAPSGYVLLSGLTIGNGSSGGTARANADTEDLFTLLWESMSDTEAPVSSGRGASAAADFAANKTITLPDGRGRIVAGKDDMGGSTASRLTAAGSGITGTTLGTSGGAQDVTLTGAQSGTSEHGHTLKWLSAVGGSTAVAVYDGTNNPALASGSGYINSSSGASLTLGSSYAANTSSAAAASSAHNNTQPTLVLNKIIKL